MGSDTLPRWVLASVGLGCDQCTKSVTAELYPMPSVGLNSTTVQCQHPQQQPHCTVCYCCLLPLQSTTKPLDRLKPRSTASSASSCATATSSGSIVRCSRRAFSAAKTSRWLRRLSVGLVCNKYEQLKQCWRRAQRHGAIGTHSPCVRPYE